MTSPALTVRPDTPVLVAAATMHARHVRRMPVVCADGHLAGIVTRADLLGVYDRPDEEIRSQILTQVIEGEFLLDSLAFTVTVDSGVVTLSGPVASEPVGRSLLEEIRRADGVVAVRSRLSCPPARRAQTG